MKSIMTWLMFVSLLFMVGLEETRADILPYRTLTITFDATGGTVSKKSIRRREDKTIGTLPTPKRDGYQFEGWYTAASGGTQITSNTTMWYLDTYHYMVVYAHWSKTGGPIPAVWQTSRMLKGLCYSSGRPDGICELKLGKANKQGIAKVSMTMTPFSGKKRTYKSVPVNVLQGNDVEVRWPQQSYYVIIEDDYFYGGAGDGAAWVERANLDSNLEDGWYCFRAELNDNDYYLFDIYGVYCINSYLLKPFESSQEFHVSGKNWDFGQIPSIKYKVSKSDEGWRQEELTGLSDNKPNYPATRLSYNSKTGMFKGSFNLLLDPIVCVDWGRQKPPTSLKKVPFKVTGVIIEGSGIGSATSKKPALSCPVYIYR